MPVGKYQKFITILFLIMLFSFSGFNIYQKHEEIYTEISEILKENKKPTEYMEYTASIDTTLATNLTGGHTWNEIYGTVYSMLGKNEENNFSYIRDKNGVLYHASFWNITDVSMKELAQRVRRMQDDLSKDGTKVVMLLYPSKYDEKWSDPYYGLPYKDFNALADEYLMYLRRYKVDYIDFREYFRENTDSITDLFFYNDHHWNVETSFKATAKLVDYIRNQYGDDWDPGNYYCDINNYYTETYDHYFMGSQGREAGEIYSELDDYTYLFPRFDSNVHWQYTRAPGDVSDKYGDIGNTLISRWYMDIDDVYERDMNSAYMGGVYPMDYVENANADEDDAKVLFLRNSYSSTVATFLAPMVKSMNMIWNNQFQEDAVNAYIKSDKFDYVFVALTADNLSDDEFPFYKDADVKQ